MKKNKSEKPGDMKIFSKGTFIKRIVCWINTEQPFLGFIQTIVIVAGLPLAIVELQASNHQAKIANTLNFLWNMKTSQFHEQYHDAIDWLEDVIKNPSAKTPPPPGMERKIAYVLDKFSDLWVLYRNDILDKKTIESTVGIEVAQFWLMSSNVLSPEEIKGFEDLKEFSSVLEQSPTVKNSNTYRILTNYLRR